MSDAKKILIPYDGSESADRALDFAKATGAAFGHDLVVATVVDLSQVDVFDGFYMTDEQLTKLQERVREGVLRKASDRLGGTKHESRLLHGPAVATLVAATEEDDIAMVVLGRTGKGALTRALVGSVSQGLSAHCKKPVVLVS